MFLSRAKTPCGAPRHKIEDHLVHFGYYLIERARDIDDASTVKNPHQPSVVCLLPDCLCEWNFLLARVKHFSRRIEENDQVWTRNEVSDQGGEPERASIAVALRVYGQIVIIAVKED
jgi:hypothetical protein